MRTTLTIDDDALAAAKVLARATHQPIGAVVSSLIRKAIRVQAAGSDRGLPVFDVPDGAEIIPGDRAGVLLADETLR